MILHNPIVSGSLSLAVGSTFVSNNGTISGSAQVIAALPSGVVSGSSQISLGGFDTDDLSEGSSNLYYTDTRVRDFIRSIDVISGSSQLEGTFLEINGDNVFSSSAQVNANTITNFDTNVRDYIRSLDVISGSSQVDVTQTTNYGTINQYTDSDFDSRLATKSTANLSEGSNLYYTVSRVKLKLNQDSVISGSSQLTTEFDSRYLNTNGDGVVSGSSQISLSGFSTSNLSEGTNKYYTDTRVLNYVNDLGVISGSTFSSPSQGTVRATINGSNTDVDTGLQIADSPQFTNLTLTGNLTVAGSTTTTTSNEVNIGDNIINLNYGGSSTTGGIYVKDGTGVSQVSGSFVWDSADGRDYWKAGKLGSEAEIVTTGNIVSKLPAGTVSGSSQITITESQISDLDHYGNSDVQSYIRSIDVISGSSQVVLNDAIKTGFDTADVSENSSNLYYTDARVKTKLNAEGVISSSAQIGVNNSTITLTAGAGLDGGGSITLNQSGDETITFTVADGVISSSAQLTTEFDTRYLNTNGDDVISGSEQVNANSITNFDSNVRDYIRSIDVISGSSQININHLDTDNLSEGSSNLYYTNTRVQSFIRSEDVISGSQQILDLVSIDEDDFSTNSATKLPTQQSVKSYVQSQVQSKDDLSELSGDTDDVTEGSSNLYYTDTRVRNYLRSTDVVSGSSQVDYNSIQNTPTTITSQQASDITSNNNKTGYTNSLVKSYINSEDVISGSAGILNAVSVDEDNFASNSDTKLPTQQSVKAYVDSKAQSQDNTDEITEGSTNLYYTDTRVRNYLRSQDVISGSSQVNANNITNFDTNVRDYIRSQDVVSGSSQIDVTQTTNYGNINQYTDSDFDSRLATKSTANLSEGSNLYYTNARVKTKLNDEGVVSGSYVSTLNGTGVVSGSSQITLSSVTGYNSNEHFTQNSITSLGTVTSGDITALLPNGTVSGSSQVSITLGTQTSGNYIATLGSGTGVTIGSNTGEGSTPTIAVDYGSSANTAVQGNVGLEIEGTSNEIDVSNGSITLGSGGTATIGLADSIAGNRTFQNNVTITGNLTVNGTTTTAASTNTVVTDKLLELGNGTTGAPAGDSGIIIERGDSNNAFIGFDESADKFVVGTGTFDGSSSGNLAISTGTLIANIQGNVVGNLTGQASDISNHSTSDLSEGTNKYYTDTRVQSFIRSIDVISGSSQISGLTASQLSDNSVQINGVDVELGDSVTFSQISNGTGTISGSSQLTSDFDTRYINTNGDGVISGSSQVNANSITNFDTNVRDYIRSLDVISGSVTAAHISGLDTGDLSEGTNKYYTDTRVRDYLRSTDVISGSSQVNVTQTANYSSINQYSDSKVKTKLNTDNVVSGSSQLLSDLDGRYIQINGDDIVSGSQQILDLVSVDEDNFASNSATKVPTQQSVKAYVDSKAQSQDNTDEITEGSTNLYYTNGRVQSYIRSIDVISGSSQVDYDSIQNQPTTISSTQSTKLGHISVSQAVNLDTMESNITTNNNKVGYTNSLVKSYINSEDVISGSSQVNYNSIQNQPTTITSTQASNITTNNNKVGYTNTLVQSYIRSIDVISGSSQVNANSITNFDTNVRDYIRSQDVVSGSSQIISLVGVDEDNMSSNSTTKFPTQQSVKAYVDSQVSSYDNLSELGGDSDDITEGSTNLYFTNGRVQSYIRSIDVISGSSQVNYNSIQNQPTTISSAQSTKLGHISVTQAVNLDTMESNIGTNNNKVGYTNTLVRNYIRSIDVISGSGQVSHDSTNGYEANEHIDWTTDQGSTNIHSGNYTNTTYTAGTGIDLSGTQFNIDLTELTLNNGLTAANSSTLGLNPTTLLQGSNVVSGSSQISLSGFSTSDLSEGTNKYYTDTRVRNYVRSIDVISGSSQVNYNSIQNQPTTISSTQASNITTNNNKVGYTDTLVRDFIRSIDVISGSSQVNYNSIQNQPTTISSAQSTKLGHISVSQAVNLDTMESNIGTNNNKTGYTNTLVRDYIRSIDVISGSVSSTHISGLDTDDLSEGSTNKYATTANVKSALNSNLGSATFGDGNDTITIPGNLIVTGTTTTNNVEVVSTTNGVVFEGNADDDNELTLLAGTVSADRTITLPDSDGTVALTGIDQTFSGANTFSSQIVSSVSTGTAPFSVSSTTKVTNLNADKLDGLTSSNFLRSNADDSASGVITITNTTATNATDVGALVVVGGVGIGGALNVAGDVVAYASSDERLKDNIELISNPIEKVQSLKGVTWNWNDNADELQQSLPNVGVIAQDVEKVLPELVTDRDNGYKGVDYAKLTGLLIEAIKEQQKQIDDLKSQIG
jgi:ferritin